MAKPVATIIRETLRTVGQMQPGYGTIYQDKSYTKTAAKTRWKAVGISLTKAEAKKVADALTRKLKAAGYNKITDVMAFDGPWSEVLVYQKTPITIIEG